MKKTNTRNMSGIDFEELKQSTNKLYKIINLINKYVKNELILIKNNKNTEPDEYKNQLIQEINDFDSSLAGKIFECAEIKTQAETTSLKILDNLYIFKTTSFPNDERIKAGNDNNDLNDLYKELHKDYILKINDLIPLFKSTSDGIYIKIFNAIIESIPYDIIIDVLNNYEKFITGQKTEKECVKSGINYTENKYTNIPKGLLKKCYKGGK